MAVTSRYWRFLPFATAVFVAVFVCQQSGATAKARTCATGGTLVALDCVDVRRAAADLRVQASGTIEARVGGSVGYSVTVSDVGARTAKGVAVKVEGQGASLVSVSSARSSCMPEFGVPMSELSVVCSITSLAPHERLSIHLNGLATAPGRIVLRVRATSSTHDARARNNEAVVTTPVFGPDSVQVRASRRLDGHPDIDLTLDAVSGRHGQDPEGQFVLDWEGHTTGHDTCLSVHNNSAYVGASIDSSYPPAGGQAFRAFLFTDYCSPGAGRDTLNFGGGARRASCPTPFFGTIPGLLITDGEITILDTH